MSLACEFLARFTPFLPIHKSAQTTEVIHHTQAPCGVFEHSHFQLEALGLNSLADKTAHDAAILARPFRERTMGGKVKSIGIVFFYMVVEYHTISLTGVCLAGMKNAIKQGHQ